MSLSVSLIQSPNKSGKWDIDKRNLYRTPTRQHLCCLVHKKAPDAYGTGGFFYFLLYSSLYFLPIFFYTSFQSTNPFPLSSSSMARAITFRLSALKGSAYCLAFICSVAASTPPLLLSFWSKCWQYRLIKWFFYLRIRDSSHIAYSVLQILYGWRGVKSGWRDKENSSPPETPINRGGTGEKVKSEEINRDCLYYNSFVELSA